MTVHTDDCDCVLEDERDRTELLRVMNDMFSMAGQPGIQNSSPTIVDALHRATNPHTFSAVPVTSQFLEDYYSRILPL
eukprot:COSAG01_NODE_63_length_29632_cov_270.650662_37_plen_78_part_00